MLAKELFKSIDNTRAELLCGLWERWQDEKDYEDINDYLAVIQKYIPSAYKMSKKPFGVLCKCDDGDLHIQVKRKGNCLGVSAIVKNKR